jgi:hypothetical protein
MFTEVRSYSLAIFLFSKGHRPVDAGFTPGGSLVFLFAPDASEEIVSYNEAKLVLNNLEAKVRAARLVTPVVAVPMGAGKTAIASEQLREVGESGGAA